MRTNSFFLAGAAVLALSTAAFGQANPNGWIQEWDATVYGTNCAVADPALLTCDGCGVDVHPVEDWSDVAADQQTLIDANESGGYDLGAGPLVLSGSDQIDGNAVADGAGVPNDNVYLLATTTIENTTDGDLLLVSGFAGDDAVILDIDGVRVRAWTRCGGGAGDFQQADGIVLGPGYHKLTVTVHEGGGGFNFRMGLRNANGLIRDGDDSGIVFHGAGLDEVAENPFDAATIVDLGGNKTDTVGNIRGKNFTFIAPIANPGGCGGGGQAAIANDPHVELANTTPVYSTARFALEDIPQQVDVANIFGGASQRGIWLDLQGLIDALPDDPANQGLKDGLAGQLNNGIINFQWLADRFRLDAQFWNPAAANPLAENAVLGDNVKNISVVYVENKTDANMQVGICTASDDSIGVWVNGAINKAVSACRGTNGGCAEIHPAVLLPGVNKIVVAVYEGGGGWGQRLRIIKGNGLAYSDFFDGTDTLEILDIPRRGSQVPETPLAFAVTSRTAETAAFDCPNLEVPVTLGGNGEGSGTVTVCESITAPNYDELTIDAPGATIEDVVVPVGVTAGGFIQAFVHVGPFFGSNCNGVDAATRTGSWISNTDGSITETNWEPAAGDTVDTDFAVAVGTSVGENGGRNPGGVVTATFGIDNNDDVNYNDYYGGDVNDNTMLSWAYVDLKTDYAADELIVGVASDDSVTVLLGPVGGDAALFMDVQACRGHGGAGTIQNEARVPTAVPAGLYKIVVKVHEGGGGHGFRLRLRTDAGPISGPDQIEMSDQPSEDGLLGLTIARKIIKWADVDIADINDSGLGYTLTVDGNASINPVGEFSGDAVGPIASSGNINFGVQSGPLGSFDNSHTLGSANASGGLAENEDGSYTMQFSGDDFWTGGDHGFFAYNLVTGDFDATIEILDRVDPPGTRWGKHGVMARQTCDQASRYTTAQMHVAGNQEYDQPRLQERRDHLVQNSMNDQRVVPGGAVDWTTANPAFARLQRRGDVFWASFSEDGENWIVAGGDRQANSEPTLLVGVAGTSHDPGQAEVTYNFTIETENLVDVMGLSGTLSGDKVADNFDEGDLAARGAEVVVGGGTFTPVINEAGRLQITQDTVASSANAVWLDDPLEGDSVDGHQIDVDVYYSGTGGIADGFNLAVVEGDFAGGAAAGKVGGGGGAAGYDTGGHNDRPAHPGRAKGYAVEIDQWDGGTGSNDRGPGNPHYHIGINFNNENSSASNSFDLGFGGANADGVATSLPVLFNDAEGLHLTIQYLPNPAEDNALVKVWASDNGAAEGDEWFEPKLVSTAVGPKLNDAVFVGVTGGTGGANATQEIDNFCIQPLCVELGDVASIAASGTEVLDPETGELLGYESGTEVTFTASLAGADAAATYTWGGGETTESITVVCDDEEAGVSASVAAADGTCDDDASADLTVACISVGSPSIPGDANSDGAVDISDGIRILNILFIDASLTGPCAGLGLQEGGNVTILDGNGDGGVDLSDGVATFAFLFLGGPAHTLGVDCITVADCEKDPSCE